MSNFTKPIPPLTPEQIAELDALAKMTDDEIDLSDIPEITEEEWRTRFKPVRLRRKNLQQVAS